MTYGKYDAAVNEALERLVHAGFFFGSRSEFRGFAMHAPMGAEALATLGFCDQVPGWVDWYATVRAISSVPEPVSAIDPDHEADWQAALGQVKRLADWAALFRHEIDDAGWRTALATWWPRLMPGMLAGLTHGLIRTAHAVRSVASTETPSTLQLHELANGLAFWAGMYQPPTGALARGARVIGTVKTIGRQPPSALFATADARLSESVDAALMELSAACAGRYALLSPAGNPVAPIHAMTAPAALRMTLPQLPPELAQPSYEAVRDVCGTVLRVFASRTGRDSGTPPIDGDDPAVQARIVHEAVELRDEHAIKISEAATREYAANPDPRYFAAAHHALELLRPVSRSNAG
jgi:Questin oxidase-like